MKVNDQLSVLFMPENSRPNRKGLFPLTVRVTVTGTRAEFMLGKYVDRKWWDTSTKRVITKENPNPVIARDVNNAITQCLAKLEKDFEWLTEEHSLVTGEMLKLAYLGQLKPAAKGFLPERTLCQVCNYKYSKFALLVKAEQRAESTLKRWRTTKTKIRAFIKHKFKKTDLPLSAVKFGLANDFLHYLLTKQGIEENTANKYLKNIKELLQIAEDQEWISKSPWSNFKTKYNQPERESLLMEEIVSLYQKPLLERLDHVRNIFLFACFTGYGFQEVLDLTPNDIFIGVGGKRWVKIDRQKTGNPECIPLLPIPASIVDHYVNDPYCIANNKLLPVKSYQNYNGYLKEVAYICEIPLELSTHIARHTFATTICLDNDVPIETVSKLLGHKSIRTTQIYAKVTKKKISNNMSELEQKLFTPEGFLKDMMAPNITVSNEPAIHRHLVKKSQKRA